MRLSITRIYCWLAKQIERSSWQQDSLINRFDQIVVFESTVRIAVWLESYKIVALVADRANIEIERCRRTFFKPICHASRLIEEDRIYIDKHYCRIKLQREQKVTDWLRSLLNIWKEIWSQWTRRKTRYMYSKTVLHSKFYFFLFTSHSLSIADFKHLSHLTRLVRRSSYLLKSRIRSTCYIA